MKKTYFLLFLCLIALSGYSQESVKAIGIRGGISSGFEYRFFTDDQTSYRALLSTRLIGQGIQLTGLKEYHILDAFDNNENFSFIYGFGAHAGFETWNVNVYSVDYPYGFNYIKRKSGLIAGLDALAALEYSVPQIPLVFGVEAKPYFNLFGEYFFQAQPFDFAFTVKYTF